MKSLLIVLALSSSVSAEVIHLNMVFAEPGELQPVGLRVERVEELDDYFTISQTLGTLFDDGYNIILKRWSLYEEGTTVLWDGFIPIEGIVPTFVYPDAEFGGAVGSRIDVYGDIHFDEYMFGYLAIDLTDDNLTTDKALIGDTFEAEFLNQTTGDIIIATAPMFPFHGARELRMVPEPLSIIPLLLALCVDRRLLLRRSRQ